MNYWLRLKDGREAVIQEKDIVQLAEDTGAVELAEEMRADDEEPK